MIRKNIARMGATIAAFIACAGATPTTGNAMSSSSDGGSVGRFWFDGIMKNHCTNVGGASVQPISLYVSAADVSSTQTQTIYLTSRIETWNGSSWVLYKQTPWISANVAPGRWVVFSPGYVSVERGRYYRVLQNYQWWAGGTRLGSVINTYGQNEYSAAFVGQTGSSPSYCYIY